MSTVTLQNADDSGESRQTITTSGGRIPAVLKNSQQVRDLLAIVDQTGDQMFVKTPAIGESGVSIFPGTQEESFRTFQAAHLQLRNLIDDMSRWTVAPEKGELDAEKATEAFREKIEIERDRAKVGPRPCVQMNARIVQMQSGNWVAWWGTDSPMTSSCLGIGRTPAEALDEFDKTFLEGRAMVADEPAPEAPAAAPASKPKKKSS